MAGGLPEVPDAQPGLKDGFPGNAILSFLHDSYSYGYVWMNPLIVLCDRS